jgi:hypothetical protein
LWLPLLVKLVAPQKKKIGTLVWRGIRNRSIHVRYRQAGFFKINIRFEKKKEKYQY